MTEKQLLIKDVARLTKERDHARDKARMVFRLFRNRESFIIDVEDWIRSDPWLEHEYNPYSEEGTIERLQHDVEALTTRVKDLENVTFGLHTCARSSP